MDFQPRELAETMEQNGADASLISVLEEIQGRYRYVPREAMITPSAWYRAASTRSASAPALPATCGVLLAC